MSCALRTNDSVVYVTKQDAQGQIDSNPIWSEARRTDGRVAQQVTYEKSSELKQDLQATKNTLTDVAYSNTFSVELTQNFMLFARSVLMNNDETVINFTASTISFVESTNKILDSGNGFTDVVEGQWIIISGASNSSLNKPYYVTNKVSNGELDVNDVPVDESAGA